ncbi:MAG: hypothetical protein JWM31_26 [Solirubrobacterales bacterium]|nr:hypothetical protein [Solirubrobacterales bacterium]
MKEAAMNPLKRHLILATLIGLLVGLVATPGATAKRSATPTERRSLGGVAKSPRCSKVYISSVSKQWALLYLTNRSGCPTGDGFSTYRKTNGRWRHRLDGPNDPYVRCDGENYAPRIPVLIQRDFGLCA